MDEVKEKLYERRNNILADMCIVPEGDTRTALSKDLESVNSAIVEDEKIDIEKERLRLDEARLQHEQQLALNELEVNKLEIQSRNKQTRLTFIGSLIGSCVTLGGIAMILNKEEVSCITSKALSFVPKIPFFNKK